MHTKLHVCHSSVFGSLKTVNSEGYLVRLFRSPSILVFFTETQRELKIAHILLGLPNASRCYSVRVTYVNSFLQLFHFVDVTRNFKTINRKALSSIFAFYVFCSSVCNNF